MVKKKLYVKPILKEVKVGGKFMQYVHAGDSASSGCGSTGAQHGCSGC
jgi:hypothetical protein